MKTLATMLALAAGLMVGGSAMACGGAAGGKLGRMAVKKVYRSAQMAARNATAGAISRKLMQADSSEAPTIGGKNVSLTLIKSTATSKLYQTTVHAPSDTDVTGSAKVLVTKVSKGWHALVQSGKYDADW